VRHALGAPLRPLVVTNIYNDPVIVIYFTLSLRAFFSVSTDVSTLITLEKIMRLYRRVQYIILFHPTLFRLNY
jgi:hypothetical protein